MSSTTAKTLPYLPHHPAGILFAHPVLHIYDCYLADYHRILTLQHRLHHDRLAGRIPDTILLLEHHSVITCGARRTANKLLYSHHQLQAHNIDLVHVRRGGGTTAHNPGQLLCYPILDLRKHALRPADYVHKLETIGIELLQHYGISAQRKPRFPGLWIGPRKIASIGVRIARGVSYHGMAININNDLTIFNYIVPCGLDGVQMTSLLQETGRTHSIAQIKQHLAHLLARHFLPSPVLSQPSTNITTSPDTTATSSVEDPLHAGS